MKKIFTFLTIAMLGGLSVANAQQTAGKTATDKTVLIYSEEDEALVYKNTSKTSKEIIIESLPGFGFEPVPVEISLNENGSYTFKKSASLILPEYYTVVITDSLTGEKFDLKTSDSYSFDVAKATPERFALQMTKIKTRITTIQ